MQAILPNDLSWRFAPRLTQLLAIGWVTIVALLFLVCYDGWLVPVNFASQVCGALTTFAVGPHFGEFWRTGLADAGCVVAIVVTAFATGAVAIERLTPEKNLWSALFSLAAGLWILSLAVLMVGFFSTSWLPLVLLLAGCWMLPAPRRFFAPNRVAAMGKLDGWEKFMLACMAVAALLSLPGALVPPFDYDSLEYHLGAPAEYLKAGRIIALPHNFYSNLPQLTEMLYLLALKLSSGSAAKLLHYGFGLGTAMVVYALAARLGTRRIGLTAAALFYCLPYVENLSQMADIDLATAFYAGLAFGAGLLWVEQNAVRNGNAAAASHRMLWLSALAAGAAVATKWTAVAVVLLPLAVFLAGTTKSLRALPVFCLLAAVPVLPWVAKNSLLMHNPVYPLLNGIFHNPHWCAGQAAVFAQKHYASFGWEGWRQSGSLIVQYSFRETGALLLLMAAPLILLLKDARGNARRAGILFVLAYAGWFLLTFRPWRFLFPGFALAAIIGAVALEAVARPARIVVGAMMLVVLTWRGVSCFVDRDNSERVPAQVGFVNCALGQVSRQEFLARINNGGTFEAILWMNGHLPPTATVLYVGEARTFCARQRVLWSTAFDRHLLDSLDRPPADPGQLFRDLRARGVTHVYVNFSEWHRLRTNYDYLQGIDEEAFRRLLEEHARQIHVTGPGAVWELDSSPISRPFRTADPSETP
jgi:4-amino-4-deoxy-L-arabinose transferase-like glycosyltransferase